MSETQSTATVAVVIVNYKTGSLVCRALDTLQHERQFLPNLHVVVVDNASPDDSFSVMASHVESQGYASARHTNEPVL